MVGEAQLTCWFTRSWRLIVRAIAARTSGGRSESSALAMSSCSMVAEVSTSLCAPGSPVIWVRKDWVTVVGAATCT